MEDAVLLAALGNVLRSLRRERSLSLSTFAVRTGIPRDTLDRYERGLQDPYIGDIYRITAALQTTPAQVFRRLDETGERACS